ncbi:MAG: hypothetical protein EON54_24145, partial [Alcaligenaceae bacterium]
MNIKKICIVAIALAQPVAFTSWVHAADASKEVSMGAASIAASPLASVEGGPLRASSFFLIGATFVVVGIGATVGDIVSVVIQNTVDGSKAVLQSSASTVREVGVSVGSAVNVVAESTGYTLTTSGKI